MSKSLSEYEHYMKELSTLEKQTSAIQEFLIKKYPDRVPRCHYCNAAFKEGWHSACCGAC